MEPLAIDELPAWANEANATTHGTIRSKRDRLAYISASLFENKERCGVMQVHLRQVVTQQQHTQVARDYSYVPSPLPPRTRPRATGAF